MIKHKQNPENVKVLCKKYIFVKTGEQGEHSRAVQELIKEIKNFVLHVFIPFYLFSLFYDTFLFYSFRAVRIF